MAHILESPNLLNTIRAEVTPAVRDFNSQEQLCDLLSQCKCLRAVYHEVLRLTASGLSVRTVTADTMIGTKKLRKGAQVMMIYRQVLMDETVFGLDAENMCSARFLQNEELEKNSSFKPFGGGAHHCPGRFILKKVVLTFVALAIARFNITPMDETAAFPKMDGKKPYTGMFGPVNGDDVTVKVEARPHLS